MNELVLLWHVGKDIIKVSLMSSCSFVRSNNSTVKASFWAHPATVLARVPIGENLFLRPVHHACKASEEE